MAEILELKTPNEEAEKIEEKQIPLFDSFMSALGGPEQNGLEELGALMALPDESFDLLSEMFLEEVEKSMNDKTTRLALELALRESGLDIEEFNEVCPKLLEEIQTNLEGDLPQDRIDFLKRLVTITINVYNEIDGSTKELIQIPFEKCHPDAKIPTYANNTDSGMDVYALDDYEIQPGETKLIPTGIKMAIPNGYEIQVRPKSGRALKTKLRVANTPGTVDAGYRDEICVIIENIDARVKDIEVSYDDHGKLKIDSILYGKSYMIEKGQKFAQLVLCKVPKAALYEVESVNEIGENRGGGFGSTGLN